MTAAQYYPVFGAIRKAFLRNRAETEEIKKALWENIAAAYDDYGNPARNFEGYHEGLKSYVRDGRYVPNAGQPLTAKQRAQANREKKLYTDSDKTHWVNHELEDAALYDFVDQLMRMGNDSTAKLKPTPVLRQYAAQEVRMNRHILEPWVKVAKTKPWKDESWDPKIAADVQNKYDKIKDKLYFFYPELETDDNPHYQAFVQSGRSVMNFVAPKVLAKDLRLARRAANPDVREQMLNGREGVRAPTAADIMAAKDAGSKVEPRPEFESDSDGAWGESQKRDWTRMADYARGRERELRLGGDQASADKYRRLAQVIEKELEALADEHRTPISPETGKIGVSAPQIQEKTPVAPRENVPLEGVPEEYKPVITGKPDNSPSIDDIAAFVAGLKQDPTQLKIATKIPFVDDTGRSWNGRRRKLPKPTKDQLEDWNAYEAEQNEAIRARAGKETGEDGKSAPQVSAEMEGYIRAKAQGVRDRVLADLEKKGYTSEAYDELGRANHMLDRVFGRLGLSDSGTRVKTPRNVPYNSGKRIKEKDPVTGHLKTVGYIPPKPEYEVDDARLKPVTPEAAQAQANAARDAADLEYSNFETMKQGFYDTLDKRNKLMAEGGHDDEVKQLNEQLNRMYSETAGWTWYKPEPTAAPAQEAFVPDPSKTGVPVRTEKPTKTKAKQTKDSPKEEKSSEPDAEEGKKTEDEADKS